MRKTVLAIGALETFAIFSFGLSIVIRGTFEHSKLGFPLAQFVIYTLFAASLAATCVGISKMQSWARTPFYLLQCFVGQAGYLMVSGTILVYQLVGVVVIVVAVAGFVSLLRTPDNV